MKHSFRLLVLFFISIVTSLHSQTRSPTEADKSALEGIIVEKYYTATAKDCEDTLGGILLKGSVTYRIYVDLKPGYSLQAVYGVTNHELRLETSTSFFNNKTIWGLTADLINDKKLNENTAALDSWVAMGGATKSHFGILRSEDKDGSIIKKDSLAKADGLIAGKIPPVTIFGLDVTFFGDPKNGSLFSSNNGSYAVFGGVKGPTDSNRILIAQLTTDGKLSFELNIQIGTPIGGAVQFVARNPQDAEIQFAGLIYPAKK